jgi:hypothetical protein
MNLGRSFLGAAKTGGALLGRAMPSVMTGLSTAGQLAANPALQQLGQKMGIDPTHFRTLGQTATNVGNALGMVPGAYNDMQSAGGQIRNAVVGAKRSLADVYAASRGAA